MSNLFGALIVLLAVLSLGTHLQYLPKATLAAIVIAAAFNLVKFDELKFILSNGRLLKMELLISFISSLVFKIETGLGIGIGVNVLYMLMKSTFLQVTLEKIDDSLLEVTWVGPLIYTNCGILFKKIQQEVERGEVSVVRVDASGISDMDSAALHSLMILNAEYSIEFSNAPRSIRNLPRSSCITQNIRYVKSQ